MLPSLIEIVDVAQAYLSSRYRRAAQRLIGHTPAHYAMGVETPIQTFYEGRLFDPLGMRAQLKPISGVPTYGLPSSVSEVGWESLLHGLLQFQLDPERSFFGDCINIVDVPDEVRLDEMFPPFGWSGRSLMGGHALTFSRLSGEIEINFSEPQDGFAHFTLRSPSGLVGQDGVLAAPCGYMLRVLDNQVRDAGPISHGKVEFATGRFYDFHYNVQFSNSAIRTLCEVNPGLVPPPLLFPGLPHAGHTMGWIAVDQAARQLVLSVVAQQFLPLGPDVNGTPLRMPPSHSSRGSQEAFEAANSALHPFIVLTATVPYPASSPHRAAPLQTSESYRRTDYLTVEPSGRCLSEYENRVVRLSCVPGYTDFGDNFALKSPVLGGPALARSPLFGRLQVQFGPAIGAKLPFTIGFGAPSPRLHSKAARLLSLLPPGTKPGLVGMHGQLHFPNRTYMQHELSLTTDPYKVSVGIVDIETGRFENTVLRKYLFQNVMRKLLIAEPRTPTDSFCYVCDGRFQPTDDGLILQLYGDFTIPYPSGYAFPLPSGGKTQIGEGSHLLPFLNITAVEESAFKDANGTINFFGTKHIRGRFGGNLALSIEARQPDGCAVTFVHGATWRGSLLGMREARIGTMRVFEIEFSIPKKTRATVGENCFAVLISENDVCQLLMVSEHETFDTWIEGRAEIAVDTVQSP